MAPRRVHKGAYLRGRVEPAAERGPYPLLHGNARNVLAEVEMHEGNRDAAVAAAMTAYRLA